MSAPVIMLVDNGSRCAAATLSLRALAAGLGAATGHLVHPVSLQHSNKIPVDELRGSPAQLFPEFLRGQLEQGQRDFVLVPLFFGNSRALTAYVPEQSGLLEREFGPFRLRQAAVLSPMPQGEPRLADILAEHVAHCTAELGAEPTRVIVVDHGSPLPEVTAVRAKVTMQLRERLADGVSLGQAVMERRQGPEYDFNGQLLGDLLDSCVSGGRKASVVLAMMFVSPGRHAGEGGDIDTICADAMARNPGLRVKVSPLVGEHPLLIEILRDRLEAVLRSLPQ
ncbi:MAG: CbiX/SirB N-terminal domain-containing protein [Sedimenticolaceae bacterium]|jgi:sirohydrochlorin ferrochelatase